MVVSGKVGEWCYTLEELVELDKIEDHKKGEWVRNPPELPCPWRKLWDTAKNTYA